MAIKGKPMQDTVLRRRDEIANGTMAFHFDKPEGFTFKPGQALDLVLAQPGGAGEDDGRHTFSIVSAPFEDELVIATRMRDSAFKRALKALPAGSRAAIDGPFGSLVLHKDTGRPAVLIAGGIGITPFISMLRQSAHDGTARQLLLLYSNRRPEDAAFLAELERLERQNGHFRLVATMTQMTDATLPWRGPTGLIDTTLLKSAVQFSNPVYYLAGPPALVEAIRKVLEEAGVDELDIRSEDFYGY
jgi:ferredoxin-NADP reductase